MILRRFAALLALLGILAGIAVITLRASSARKPLREARSIGPTWRGETLKPKSFSADPRQVERHLIESSQKQTIDDLKAGIDANRSDPKQLSQFLRTWRVERTQIGENEARVVAELMDSPQPEIRETALLVLSIARSEEARTRIARAMLEDPEASVRGAAVAAAAFWQGRGADVFDTFSKELRQAMRQDADARVRADAVYSVPHCNHPQPDAGRLPAELEEVLRSDASCEVREAVVVRLAGMGSESARQALWRAIENPAELPAVRTRAIGFVGRLDGEPDEVIRRLSSLAVHSAPPVRQAVQERIHALTEQPR